MEEVSGGRKRKGGVGFQIETKGEGALWAGSELDRPVISAIYSVFQ